MKAMWFDNRAYRFVGLCIIFYVKSGLVIVLTYYLQYEIIVFQIHHSICHYLFH